jgi:4-hydroxy-tetrahydrodipicolinate synthase
VKRDELKKLIRGPIATVPTAFDDQHELDLGTMAALTQLWVESGLVAGVAVIKVAAAMGEGPMLADDEWPYLLRTVVQAARGKAAVVCGIHYKDTKRTIHDARRAQDLGAIGLQISPPIFNDPTQDDIVRYYEAVSAAIDIGILVYNTYWYPHGNILPETFMKMKDFEQVVAIKWGVPEGQDYDAMAQLARTFNIIDNSSQPGRCYRLGGVGYINLTAEVYPPHDLAILELLVSGKYNEAQAAFDAVNRPLNDMYARLYERSGGQSTVKKGMMALMGPPMGPPRPPSLPMNEEELAELRRLLKRFGWPLPS